ncbi:GIY-YIG nuclease family protein [Thiocapsa roseopersicina]|uniref:T5orf172 domain-containing protein n=1 Tax=Thiocapsa roseopersicina TaxID=1058 RepID=A0A1H3D195_THIRO|nr:GIY-YIG nuclease family protein [Thiocapsa roseopersicina]SDX60243.1 T5orf172 domain-containing protein [Thiocapsa roseopersicina]
MPTSSDPATLLMLAAAAVAALIAVIVLAVVLARVVHERDRLKQRTDRTIAEQQAEIDSLARFRDIRDAAATAEQLRNASKALYEGARHKEQEILNTAERAALEIASKAEREAAGVLEVARHEAAALRSAANLNAKTRRERADSALAEASAQAERIIASADQRAVQIAGDAYRALRESDRLKQVAEAMRNVIDGYDDRYFKPTFGLLDELAETYGFDDSGRQLKAARERTRLMVAEQRRIREQIREEQKAQREIERALKDSAREEKSLQKALAKVQAEAAQSSEAQRAFFDARLAELHARLAEAEARNQRALSMAQQTKAGHVYVISNIGSFGEDVFKVGMTRRLEPLDRVRELGDASVPFAFDVHALIWSEDAPALETALHRQFIQAQVNKVNPRKEFFQVPLGAIRRQLEAKGILASWTMTAAAAEYRESLALAKQLAEDPEKAREWTQRQYDYDLAADREEMEAEEEALANA